MAGLVPSAFGRPSKQPQQSVRRIHHKTKTAFVDRDHAPGALHDFSHRPPLIPNDLRIGHNRPQPMKKIQDLRPANPGKQVLVAARKSHYFVRKDRPNYDYLVVIKHQAVDLDRDVHGKKPMSEVAYVLSRKNPNLLQGRWFVPGMIEKPHFTVLCLALRLGDIQALANSGITHRLMRAEGHQNVQRARCCPDLAEQRLEY